MSTTKIERRTFCIELQKKVYDLIKQTDGYLNHAPEREHLALCSTIRNLQYSIDLDLIQLIHSNNELKLLHGIHIKLEQLKHAWRLFYDLEYFSYVKGVQVHDLVVATRRSALVSTMIRDIGRSLGTRIKICKGYSRKENKC